MHTNRSIRDFFVLLPPEERNDVWSAIAGINFPRIRSMALFTIAIEVLLLLRIVPIYLQGTATVKTVHYIALYSLMIVVMCVALYLSALYRKDTERGSRWASWVAPLGSFLVLAWGVALSLLDMSGGSTQVVVYVGLQYLVVFMFLLPPLTSLSILLFVQIAFTVGMVITMDAGDGGLVSALINTWINMLLGWLVSRAQYASAYRQHETQRTVEAKNEELQKLNLELEKLAITDPLTQLMNRRSFDLVALQEWHRAQRDELPVTLAVVDVDLFKQYNDVYGHQMGDSCLRLVSDSLRKSLRRATDIISRYGGEEFVIMLVGDEPWQARAVLDRACRAVEEMAIPHADSDVSNFVTVSIGAYCSTPSLDVSFEDMLRHADQYLYAAKSEGRNRITWRDDNQQRPTLSLITGP